MRIKSLLVVAASLMLLGNGALCQGLLGGLKKGLGNIKQSIDKNIKTAGQEKQEEPNNQQIGAEKADGKEMSAEKQKIEAEMKEYKELIAKMDDAQLMKELDETIASLQKIINENPQDPARRMYIAKSQCLAAEGSNNRGIIYARLFAIAIIPEMDSTADFLKEQRTKVIDALKEQDTVRLAPEIVGRIEQEYGFKLQEESKLVLASVLDPIAREIAKKQIEEEDNQREKYNKGKTDPAFIFPRRDVCNSEIELYKNIKSGTNREIINGGPLDKFDKSKIDTSEGFYATFIKTDKKRSEDESVIQVTYTFAQKGKMDAVAVLVSVKVDIFSATVTFENFLKKYATRMQIEKPQISDTVKSRKVMFPHEEGSEVLEAVEMHEAECLLNKDGLEVRIKGSYIKPVIKKTKIVETADGTKNTLTEEEKQTVQLIVKDHLEAATPHSIIQITDLNQVNAYKPFFDRDNKAHAEAEKKQKEAERKAREEAEKKQKEAEKKQKEAAKEELLDF